MEFQMNSFHFHNLYPHEQLKLPVGDVFQVSELQLPMRRKIMRHNQWCDEITYVLSGSAQIISGNKKELLGKGWIHYIKNGLDHEIIANSENFRFICVGFAPNKEYETNIKLKQQMKGNGSVTVYDDGNVGMLSRLLINEFYAWDDISSQSANAYINQILLAIYRLLRDADSGIKGKPQNERSTNHSFYKILRYIDRDFINIDSIKSVANEMKYSEYYISHLFASKLGISAKKYLMTKKISYAVEMLKTTKLSVEEISDYLNFSAVQSFRRVFKQYMGKTPTELREEH